jgi:Tol biopolymer transport system component
MLLKQPILRSLAVLWLTGTALAGCNLSVRSSKGTPTPTPTPSLTPTAAVTATATETPTATLAPTITPVPSRTPTPTTPPVPTETYTPTATPYPATGLANDQWQTVTIPDSIRNGLDRPYFSIVSANERTGGISNPNTPMPANEVETLYMVDPTNGQKIEVFDLPASTERRIFWAPDGKKLVYFMEPTLLEDGTRAGGLYLLNLSLGVSLRLFNIPSLNPRGIPDHRPAWSPDSSQLAVALPTAYDVDIFVISADGSTFENATAEGSYDLWPTWSPDGRRLAFVSDRGRCPTWAPGEPGSCSSLDATPPTGGNLFVMDVATGDVQQISEVWVDGPPMWVSNLQLAFTTGLSDPLSTQSDIWITNIQAGTARRITEADGSLNLGAAWSPGGVQVLYHRASEPSSVVLKDTNGTLIGSIDKYLFSRFGFSAAWSPGGEWVAFGGKNAQCPYGLVVARNNLDIFYAADTPHACDPSYSPDGRWLAYAGIQTRTGAADARLDLYIADANGYAARNLTSQLKGEVQLVGWVGSTP